MKLCYSNSGLFRGANLLSRCRAMLELALFLWNPEPEFLIFDLSVAVY